MVFPTAIGGSRGSPERDICFFFCEVKNCSGGQNGMKSTLFGWLLVVLPVTLAAQSLQDGAIPLNNWPAPRQVRRSQIQVQQRAANPKLQLPGSAAPDSLVFVPITPCRLADTRTGSGYAALGSTPLATLTPRNLPIAGACGVESVGVFDFPGPEAYSLNVTVVPLAGTTGGYLLAYPNPATPIPLVASMTWNPGASYQTGAVVSAASSDGSVNLVANSATNVVVDINGYYAAPTDAQGDTALGTGALLSDTATSGGTENTAFGYLALLDNNSGGDNTAVGFAAMENNTSGGQNTAVGSGALQSNALKSENTAIGYQALKNTVGLPSQAAYGSGNTAVGWEAMQGNVLGYGNVAVGASAMQSASGGNSVAVGMQALGSVTGYYNIGIGYEAGISLRDGENNIMIGHPGVSSDTGTIRIGSTSSQTSTYIAGIRGATTGNSDAVPVVIDSNGQLGTMNSSVRFKEDIQDMANASSGLLRLRPVTYRYKQPYADGSRPIDYGLIAEEVAEVYPDLVVKGVAGEVQTVQYQKLTPMLLNELQKQHEQIQEQRVEIQKLEARLAALEAQSGPGQE
jgi:hypothetical protein